MAAPAKLLYNLINLPVKAVVQKFYIGTSYIYAMQVRNGLDLIISRATKPASGYDVDFKNGADKMTLENFGHSQTFEYYEHNGKGYWWVGTKPGDGNWATQLARIEFVPGKTLTNNTSVTRLARLNYATDLSSFSLYRSEGALSSDKKTLMIACVDTSKTGHFALYNNEALNTAMDKVESTHGYVDLYGFAKIDAYHIPDLASHLVTESIQGYELSNANSIYISSGQAYSDEHKHHDDPGITKFAWKSASGHAVPLYNINWKPSGSTEWIKNVEMEGIQIGSTDIYAEISYHPMLGGAATDNRIYYVPKTEF